MCTTMSHNFISSIANTETENILEQDLGDSQLIPGMADFSQGGFQQSVRRVKKKSQWLQIYPNIILEM